ncbi:beta-phosphoglucomutase family hydrolase [uncultured Draconibacterium sp.]|uniref:HAD family hydrolase n=1 Tax=uncultured Draconibacterium sp. TaxID=1573823 RepID=UPI0025D990A1|nr:beta-phosphoglucomutase family hydrolase [uncultured Draconibacterium sp.]
MQKLEIDPKAKGLIFDLDGTLADTMPVHFVAYQKILGKYGVDYSAKMFLSLAGVPAVETIERINEVYGTDLNAKEVGHEKEAEYERMMHQMKPIEPVIELVMKYHKQLPMAVGTGGYKRLALKTLEIIGLKDYLDILVSADDVKHPKPHPETFLQCAAQMGVAPADCQVFEDGEPGMVAARSAGMIATLVTEYYDVFKA